MWIYIIILAVTQGIAEFLPISSSGHLTILGIIFDFPKQEILTLSIILHAGSLLAILAFYFKLLLGFLHRDKLHLLLMIIVGSIPAGVAGVGIKLTSLDQEIFNEPLLIGLCFMITATLLRMSGKSSLSLRSAAQKELPPTPLEKISLKETLIIGVAQMFAILPGLSRSGTTISAGVLSGVNREAAGVFSFLLAIPAIGGAAFLELLSLIRHGVPQGSENATLAQMAVGLLLSATVSFCALSWLTRLIKQGKLAFFSYYLYFAGIATIITRLVLAFISQKG